LSVLGRTQFFEKDSQKRGLDSALKTHHFNGRHLLLVEDNEINREFAAELLHSLDITLDEAVNGEEAVAMVQLHPYDGVLMDIQMPVMDGLEAARRIRALAQQPGCERFASLPIIAMTAMAMTEDAERCLQAGMNDFVTKPIAPAGFVATLAKWLQAGRIEADTAAETASSEVVAPEIPADLLALKNLDAVQGIRRIGGKPEAYRKQLRRFREHYSDSTDKLLRMIKENGMAAGEEYCHALKGVCGNLASKPLSACVTGLDDMLKQGTMPPPEQFEQMRQLLWQTMSEIDGLSAPADSQPESTESFDRDELQAKLLALTFLLKNDLGAADLLLAELSNGLAGTETAATIADIAKKMDIFAIDEAIAEIAELSRRLR
jgi:CheY-like chemotaxis protein/HPt (histidine-containing phosphotransfer) domain-containing protein